MRGAGRILRVGVLLITLAGGLGVVLGALLPWVVTGDAERNSFQLLSLARRFGVLGPPWQRAGAVVWYFAPLCLALAGLAALSGRRSLAAGLGTMLGLGGVGMVIAVRSAPLDTGAGLPVTLVSGILAACGGTATLLTTRSRS